MMATYVEALRHYGAFQSKVELLSGLVDEQGGDRVHLQQMWPRGRVHSISWFNRPILIVCVNEDVKPKQVVVVVETSNVFLHHVVDIFVAAENCFYDNILDATPERFRVLATFPQPSPELVHGPFVVLVLVKYCAFKGMSNCVK